MHHGGAGRGREREQEIENLFEKIMTENFPNLMKKIDIQVQYVQRVPNKMRPMPSHITIKMQKLKDNLKSSKKAVSYLKGSSHKTVS